MHINERAAEGRCAASPHIALKAREGGREAHTEAGAAEAGAVDVAAAQSAWGHQKRGILAGECQHMRQRGGRGRRGGGEGLQQRAGPACESPLQRAHCHLQAREAQVGIGVAAATATAAAGWRRHPWHACSGISCSSRDAVGSWRTGQRPLQGRHCAAWRALQQPQVCIEQQRILGCDASGQQRLRRGRRRGGRAGRAQHCSGRGG